MKTQNVLMDGQQCLALLQQWVPMQLLVKLFQVFGDINITSKFEFFEDQWLSSIL